MSPTSSNLGIQNIGQISIIVHDLQRATAFYRDVLGLPLLFTVPNLAFFDCGGVRLMLGPAETAEFDHPSSILYFRVASDRSHAHIRSLDGGVPRLRGKHSSINERSPARKIAFYRGESCLPPRATRLARITVSFYLHA